MRSHRAQGNEQGFTVVEILLSIALMATLIPAVVEAFTAVVIFNARAQSLATANILAETKIEGLRSLGYNSLAIGTTDFSSDLPASLSRTRSGNYAISSPTAGIKLIVLSITYDDRGTTRTLTYHTFISETGVGQ